MTTQTILFDFGGTLDADGLTWPERFFSLYQSAGITAPRASFDKAFYAADDALIARLAGSGASGPSFEETVRLQVAGTLTALAPESLPLAETLAAGFLADCRRHFERNRPLLEALGKTRRLGVVSNFYGNLEAVLRSERLDGLFGAWADSAVVGACKPDAALFRHALGQLGAAPADATMVGDSIPRDMRGAESLGMRHALLSHGGRARCCPEAQLLARLVDFDPETAAAAPAR